uniref:Uncharacterized protein n=1 Tax=Octopus bimaculoides TaxID=37653 RepID=A0A0L8FIV4_OCTBM
MGRKRRGRVENQFIIQEQLNFRTVTVFLLCKSFTTNLLLHNFITVQSDKKIDYRHSE